MAGTLAEQLANEGDTVAVGQPLFRVDESAAATASDAADASPAATDDAPLEEIDVPVPNLGDSITEGTVAGVHAGPGTVVAMDEVVVEVDTDKVGTALRFHPHCLWCCLSAAATWHALARLCDCVCCDGHGGHGKKVYLLFVSLIFSGSRACCAPAGVRR